MEKLKLDELLILDETYVEDMDRAITASKRKEDKAAIYFCKVAIDRLEDLEGLEDEDARIYHLGMMYGRLGMHFKYLKKDSEALSAKKKNVQYLERALEFVENPSKIKLCLSGDYMSIANLKHKFGEDDTSALERTQELLWELFKSGNLNKDKMIYKNLGRSLIFLSMRTEGEEKINYLNKQEEFFTYLIDNDLYLPRMDPLRQLNNIKRIKKELAA